jgi:Ca-activated chloride channel family protein
MTTMNFAEPIWLLAGLIACMALAWAWRRYDIRQRASLAAFASPRLHEQLTASVSVAGRNWKRGMFLASLACLFVALARPQAGFRWEEVKRRGIEVIFAVDTSRSMLTPDVKPDRLTRAKLAVDDFVSRLDGDGIGLIAFAGNAFLQCPITLDYDAFHESLADLDTATIPRGGTDISSAIGEAMTALQDRPNNDKILVILTDGEDLEGNALTAAREAAKTGLKIYTVGVGTPNGDLIPLSEDQGGAFIKDEAGQFVNSRLDEAGLKAIAEAAHGLYTPLGAQGQGLDLLYRRALAPLSRHDLASRRQKIFTERFQWPLAAAMAFLLTSVSIGTRRRRPRKQSEPPVQSAFPVHVASRSAVVLGLLCLVPLQQAKASPTTAEKAYLKGDFATAQREYAAAAQSDGENPGLQFNTGTAAYRAGQFPQAAEAFQKALKSEPTADPKRLAAQESDYYDLGNTLYRTGQKTAQLKPDQTIQDWGQAVKAYDASLQLQPTDIDAKFNRDFVQKKLDDLKKQQQQQKQQQKQDQQSQNQGDQGQSEKKPDGKDQPQNPDQKSQSGQKPTGNNQKNQGQQTDAQGNSGQQEKQQQSESGAKPDQQESPGELKAQPKSANAGPQTNAKAGADQSRQVSPAAAESTTSGQMSPEDARALLDSLKDGEHRLPTAPVARGQNAPQPEQPTKDW